MVAGILAVGMHARKTAFERQLNYHKRRDGTCKLYQESKELKLQNEHLRLQVASYTAARWNSVEDYTSSVCDFPRKFDHHFDVAFGGCELAKKGDKWDLATRSMSNQILLWYCRIRENSLTNTLPKKQRRKWERDAGLCALRWATILDDSRVTTLDTSVEGLRAIITWKVKRG